MRWALPTSKRSPSINTRRNGRFRLFRNTVRYCSTIQPMPPRPMILSRLPSVRPHTSSVGCWERSGDMTASSPEVLARPAAVLSRVGRPAALGLDLHASEPLLRDVAAPLLVALEKLVRLEREAMAVDGQLQVKLGRLALDV